MKLSQVKIKGFRNFKDATFNLNNKCLIIGPNDIGKTNLLYAIRLLLDKSLTEFDLEPQDSDFYVFEDTNDIVITLKFEDITEDCVLSRLKGSVSDSGVSFLRYNAHRDASGAKTFNFYAGHEEEALSEISGRYYLKVLNFQYIKSNRDLGVFIKRERQRILEEAKQKRSEDEQSSDVRVMDSIRQHLSHIEQNVPDLSYIKNATSDVNRELTALSVSLESQKLKFDSGASEPDQFVSNLKLVTEVKGKTISVGGDGKNNQIFLAMWGSRLDLEQEEPLEITFYGIEEPEAHLHPHQQRKLADYIISKVKGQVLITTHSPQIACEFKRDSIVSLFDMGNGTHAANEGCTTGTQNPLIDFGYRLNIIRAEAFFADVVFLVEGVSEILFFKALAQANDIDLDRLNVSILMVEGVDFVPYAELFNSLNIPLVVRTDNDIFKIPKKDEYRLAGIERAITISQALYNNKSEIEAATKEHGPLPVLDKPEVPVEARPLLEKIIEILSTKDIFLSDSNLERDILSTAIRHDLEAHYGTRDDDELIKYMQSRKGTSMFTFLNKSGTDLSQLKDDAILTPLFRCKELAEKKNAESDTRTDTDN